MCINVFLGLESGSDKVLKNYNKKFYFRPKYILDSSKGLSASSVVSLLNHAKNLMNKKLDKLYNAYSDKPIYEPLKDLVNQEIKIENLKDNYVSKQHIEGS